MMFDKDVLELSERLNNKWHNKAERFKEVAVKGTSESGIPLKAVYTPLDIENLDYEEIGVPGEFPFTRGIYPYQYQVQPWMTQFGFGYGLPEHTRERYEYLKKEGMTGYKNMDPTMFIVSDLATRFGIDPDHPEARGMVGKCGIHWCTIKDFERLFDGLPIDRMNVVFEVDSPAMVALAMYIVYAERRGIPKEKLRGNSRNMLFKDWFENVAKYPPEASFKLMVELIKYASRHMPLWNTITCSGYNMHEAGANAVQEIAFSLAALNAVSQECRKAGLDLDNVIPRYGWYMSSSDDFFESIAKLRALRRMWAKIAKERLGCKNPKSLQPRIHVQTAGSSLTAQQPLNNISRIMMHTLAAVLSGVNSVWPVGYDEALALPTEEAVTLSLRAQQIILHESHIPHVSDPLGGSYYLEWLTKEIEERAWKLFEEVNTTEKYIKRCKNGWFKKIVEENAYKWRQAMDRGEKIKVGVNKNVVEEEQEVSVFKIDPEIERTAKERVRKFRDERKNGKEVNAALKRLRESAERLNKAWPQEEYLMDNIIEAVRAQATLGEISDVLKDVFGWGYTY